jgi:hypothetical protein
MGRNMIILVKASMNMLGLIKEANTCVHLFNFTGKYDKVVGRKQFGRDMHGV